MKELSEEKACACTLNRIFGYRPKIARALIEYYGSAAAVFCCDLEKLKEESGLQQEYTDKINSCEVEKSYRELERLSILDIDFISITDDCYPGLLKECSDPPAGIYIRSSSAPEAVLGFSRSIAFVGTRDMSPYGKEWCIKIIKAIGNTGHKPVIVSGLAIGIDGIAHQAAIDSGLPTIAVMATGIDDVYPSRHTGLSKKIIASEGSGLITDYPPGTSPEALNFIRRNRIIAGLSDTVILVESKTKGGGMITARQAFSYDRDVYALQGRIDDFHSGGCNQLIYQKIAEPIVSVEELVKKLGFGKSRKTREVSIREILNNQSFNKLDDGIKSVMYDILELIRESGLILKDDIASMTGIPYHELSSLLALLETEGLICIDILQRCTINHRLL